VERYGDFNVKKIFTLAKDSQVPSLDFGALCGIWPTILLAVSLAAAFQVNDNNQ